MKADWIEVASGIVNVGAFNGAHWDKNRLYVYLDGGHFIQFFGTDAQLIFDALSQRATNLVTGEVKAKA